MATGTSDELAPQLEAVLRRCVAMVQASPDRWPELTELLLPYAPVLRVQRRDSDGDAAAGSPVHARQRARPAASALTPARMDSDIDVLVEQLRVGASHDDDGTLDRALADGARRAASQPGTGGSGDASADESGGKEEGKNKYAGKEADAVVVGEEVRASARAQVATPAQLVHACRLASSAAAQWGGGVPRLLCNNTCAVHVMRLCPLMRSSRAALALRQCGRQRR